MKGSVDDRYLSHLFFIFLSIYTYYLSLEKVLKRLLSPCRLSSFADLN